MGIEIRRKGSEWVDTAKKKAWVQKLIVILFLTLLEIALLIGALVLERKYIGTPEGIALLETLKESKSSVDQLGILRYPVMVLVQIVQMILALIPGGPLAFLLGFMFGTIGGAIVGTIGNIIGTMVIVWGVNRFGMKFVNLFCNSKGFEKLKFLHDPIKRDALIFLLFVIPGTPKDLITFFLPFTKAKPSTIVWLACVGRLPALILSTAVGATLAGGNLRVTIILCSVTILLSMIGVLVKDKVMKK